MERTQEGESFDGRLVARRLRARRGEIERAFARACAAEGEARGYEHGIGLQRAVAALIGYTIECIASGEDRSTPVPAAPIAATRKAAREAVSLDTVLVRFIAGHTLLNEFVLKEVGDLPGQSLRRVQALQGSILLRLAALLAREYKEELGRRTDSAQRQRALVERLLMGAPVELEKLPYSFEGWHLGLVVSGPRALDAARVRAESLGGALLTVPQDDGAVWAWIGSGRKISMERFHSVLEGSPIRKARFAVGEPGEGVEGWRSSHFEAQAADAVAARVPQPVTYFSNVALEAIALRAPDLARSLQAAYLTPLSQRSGGAATLRQTLRAYFAAGRNASSAASALRVTRRTVENRLRRIENELGRSLHMCGAELEMALRLETLKDADLSSPA